MTSFTIHTMQSAPESVRPTFEQLQARVGFVPNLAATLADNPLALEAYGTLGAIFGRGTFSPAEQQIILTATAIGNECAYCVAAHSTFAKALGVADSVLEAIRAGQSPSDPRLAALVSFTYNVVCQRGEVSAADLQRFLDAGFTRAHALEVLIGVSQGTLASFVYKMAGTPLDAGFHPQKWEKSA